MARRSLPAAHAFVLVISILGSGYGAAGVPQVPEDPEQSAQQAVRDALLAGPVKVWTSLNMGPGSGLDADSLDGYSAADFLGSDGSLAARTAALEGFVDGGHFKGKSFTNEGTDPSDIEMLGIRNNPFGPILELRNTAEGGRSWLWQSGAGPTKAGTLRLHERNTQVTPIAVTDSGMVGINTEFPGEVLTVNGNARVAGPLTVESLRSVGGATLGSLVTSGTATLGRLVTTEAYFSGNLNANTLHAGDIHAGTVQALGGIMASGTVDASSLRATGAGSFGPTVDLINIGQGGRAWALQSGMGPSREGHLGLTDTGSGSTPLVVTPGGSLGVNVLDPTATLEVNGSFKAGTTTVESLSSPGAVQAGAVRADVYQFPGEYMEDDGGVGTASVVLIRNDFSSTKERSVVIGSPSSNSNRVIMVKNLDDTNTLTMTTEDLADIEGHWTYTVGIRAGVVLYSDGTAWWVMAKT